MKERRFKKLIEDYIEEFTATRKASERGARGLLCKILDAKVPFETVYSTFLSEIEQPYEMDLQKGLENDEVSWMETLYAILVFKLWASGPRNERERRKFLSIFNRYEPKTTLILGKWGVNVYAEDSRGSEKELFFLV